MMESTELRSAPDDARAKELIMANLIAQSRTAVGVLNTSSTLGKALLVPDFDNHDELATLSRSNASDALAFCYAELEGIALDARGWAKLILGTHSRLVAQIVTTDDDPFRTNDTTGPFPYVRAAHVRRCFDRLCLNLEANLKVPTRTAAIDAAAYTIWMVNLRGHLFVDACARTAVLLSGCILARNGQTVPIFPTRADLIRAAYDINERIHWMRWLGWFRAMCNT